MKASPTSSCAQLTSLWASFALKMFSGRQAIRLCRNSWTRMRRVLAPIRIERLQPGRLRSMASRPSRSLDDAGQFMGLIPPHQMLRILLAEHEEDLARLGGFLRQTSIARVASEESISRRFLHRLPWLLLGLGGAMVATDIVRAFEEDLQKNVTLAFFVAGVVYLADAVGTQTETVVVRGLSVGVSIRRVLSRELLTGLAIGIVLAGIALPFLFFRWGDWRISVAVSISLAAACSTATIAAMALPWLFNRMGVDPAFGSGPLATVVQDLLSIIIYFWVVTSIAG